MPAKSNGAKSRWSEIGRRGSVNPCVNCVGNVAGLRASNGYGVPAANVYTPTASALNTPVFAMCERSTPANVRWAPKSRESLSLN